MTAQELKNAILQLAVQGKLVPQCKEDEPASELLKRICAEKDQNGIKGKKLPPITDEEIPFDIPENWEWVRLGEIGSLLSGYAFKSTEYEKSGVQVVRISDLADDTVSTKDAVYYSKKDELNQYLVVKNSFLICLTGSIGKMAWVQDNIPRYLNQRVGMYISYDVSITPYLWLFLHSPYVINQWIASKTSTNGNIKNSNVTEALCPIPPLAEQERIVAKIEELMPLVEEYGKAEEQLTKLNAEFPDKLRKSILQQAVQGKLTERDPADEPASELIKRIKTEKEALIKSGKIKKEKPLPPISDDEKPFDIPDTWEWVRLGDIVRYQGGYAYKSDTYVGCSNNQIIRLGNVKNNKLLLDSAPVFVSDHIACETEEYRIMPNTILFTMTGTKGKRDYFYTCCTTENNMGSNSLYLNQRVGCLKADGDICLEWLVFFLQTETVLSQIFATATGNVNQANIGSNSTLNLVLPIPPLAEQKRIVKRVEELLALCDELK